MKEYFELLFTGAKSLLIGLGVTFRAMIKPNVTVHYPREKIAISPQFRGHTDLVKDAATGTHKCISCMMCEKDCPCNCISVAGETREGVKGKVLTSYLLDFTKCSLCGICVEVCPTAALEFSQEYELASRNVEDFHYDLLKRLEARG
jgi:NADH-quinone oxidoreductase subunit I